SRGPLQVVDVSRRAHSREAHVPDVEAVGGDRVLLAVIREVAASRAESRAGGDRASAERDRAVRLRSLGGADDGRETESCNGQPDDQMLHLSSSCPDLAGGTSW